MGKILVVATKIMNMLRRADFEYSVLEDGKIKLCFIFNPKDIEGKINAPERS